MKTLRVYQYLGFVMGLQIAMETRMNMLIPAVITSPSSFLVVTSLCTVLGNWTCRGDELQCDSGKPVCVPSYAVCDGIRDCMNGTDENSNLCGENNDLVCKFC